MKHTVMTMIVGLACIATAFAQMSEERVPAKGTFNIANMAFLSQHKVYGSLVGGIKET